MTVTTATSRIEYAGDGATTAFSVPFYFLANGDLKVYQAGALKTITTHYTVTGAGNPAGGTVTFVAAPGSSDDVVIYRDPAITQSTDYVENDPFPAESHETALDRLTMIAQRSRDLLTRAVRLPDSEADAASMTLPEKASRLSHVIGFDTLGNLTTYTAQAGTSLIDLAASTGSDLIGFIQAGTGAVARTAQDKLREVVSVKDFGALGNWNGTTGNDDTAEIQAALDSGAAHIYIPTGVYYISSTLSIPATVKSISGDTFKSILVSQTSTASYLIDLASCAINIDGLVLYGGNISGVGGAEVVPSTRHGIDANVSGDRGRFKDVVIYGFDIGMFLGKTDASSYMHLFDHCDFNSCNTGLYIIDGVNQTSLLNCVFRDDVNYGLRVEPTQVGVECVALALYNCVVEYTTSGTAGAVFKNIRGLDVSACYFEGNKTAALYIYGDATNGAQAVSIHDSYFFLGSDANQRGDGVKIGENVLGATIKNNHFEGYTVASYYPVKSIGYSGSYCSLQDNMFNNVTVLPVIADTAIANITKGTLDNHSLVRNAGKTNGAGNLTLDSLGKLVLFNGAGRLFVKITITRHSDDVVTVFDEQQVFLRAIDSGGSTVGVGYRPNPPTGNITFSAGATTAFNGALFADLSVAVAGGAADTYHSFVVELVDAVDAALMGDKYLTGTFS